jgi:hypothetical protein
MRTALCALFSIATALTVVSCDDDDSSNNPSPTPADTIPAITGISPATGTAGTLVSIRGRNLGVDNPALIDVRFGTESGEKRFVSDTLIVVEVPTKADTPLVVWLGTVPLRGPAFTYQPSYFILGRDMSAYYQNVYVKYEGEPVTNALVRVNNEGFVQQSEPGYFNGHLTSSVPAGDALTLRVEVGSKVFLAVGSVPQRPAITAPLASASVNVTDSLLIQWTCASDPDTFQVGVHNRTDGSNVGVYVSPSSRQVKLSLSLVNAGDAYVSVMAYEFGAFTGQPLDGRCRMNIRNDSPDRDITLH